MRIPEYKTIDEVVEMTPVYDADIQARIDAAIEDAGESQRVRNTVQTLLDIAQNGTRRELYRAMCQAFVPLPSRKS